MTAHTSTNHVDRRRWSAAWAVIAGLIASFPASAARRDKEGFSLTFVVYARDTLIGRGRLTVSQAESGPDAVRAARLEGKAEDLAAVIYAGTTDATSWLDGDRQPLAARWTSGFAHKPNRAEANYVDNRVQATFSRPGHKPFLVDRQLAGRPHDLVSFLPWLMTQTLSANEEKSVNVYTGMDVCLATLRAGPSQTIDMRGQRRHAQPVDIRLSECRVHRDMTIWFDFKTRLPLKMTTHHRLLGEVVLWLESAKKVRSVGPEMPKLTNDAITPQSLPAS